MKTYLSSFAANASTDTGLVRTQNEDAFLCRDLAADQCLWLVADGVAGRDAGELASATCVAVFEALAAGGKFEAARNADMAQPLLAMAVQKAHAEVSRLALQSAQKLSMSCTLTAALATGRRIDLVHVGDSRAYVLRGGTLRQITEDQTLARQLVSSGRMREDQLARHPDRNTLSQSVGLESTEHPFAPAFYRVELDPDDRLMLCSDGLSDMVNPDVIAQLLGTAADPDTAVTRLIAAALEAGGRDNVTVIVAEPVSETSSGFADASSVSRVRASANTPASLNSGSHLAMSARRGRVRGQRWGLVLLLLLLAVVVWTAGPWWASKIRSQGSSVDENQTLLKNEPNAVRDRPR